ncbi:MAG: hypothetical protein WB643_06980 [Candidatus Bathyarchaeia archaeon]
MANVNPKRKQENGTKIILIILLVLLALAFPSVLAQQTYTQPMYEVQWTTHTLLVSIPDTLPDAKTSMLQAMDIWNKAQTWFIQSYYPNQPEAMFNLKAAQGGQVQVTVQYVSSLPNGWWAETTQSGTKISIVISHASGNVVIAAHELGHVLGLGDNSINGDLERSSNVFSPYPSTLNLYGVFLQAKCQCYTYEDSISLPAQIPYTIWNPNLVVVPEFPNMLPVLVVAALASVIIPVKLRRHVPICSSQNRVPY